MVFGALFVRTIALNCTIEGTCEATSSLLISDGGMGPEDDPSTINVVQTEVMSAISAHNALGGTEDCDVKLVWKLGSAPCTLGETYGCASGWSMFVDKGCRGFFTLRGENVYCRSYNFAGLNHGNTCPGKVENKPGQYHPKGYDTYKCLPGYFPEGDEAEGTLIPTGDVQECADICDLDDSCRSFVVNSACSSETCNDGCIISKPCTDPTDSVSLWWGFYKQATSDMYVLGSPDGCPKDTVRIEDKDVCRTASLALGKVFDESDASFDDYPRGCYTNKYGGLNGHAGYNSHSTGGVHGKILVVCQKA